MGYALAQAFTAAGAQVELISGPVALQPPARVTAPSTSAVEMCDAATKLAGDADFYWRGGGGGLSPGSKASEKMKKQEGCTA